MFLINSIQIDHQQNKLLQFADWVLTPCRRTFHGKEISLITHNVRDSKVETPVTCPTVCDKTETPRGFKRFLWATLAISTVVFAALAIIVKLIIRPKIKNTLSIGTPDTPCKNVNKVVELINVIKKEKVSGKIVGYCSLTSSQEQLSNKEVAKTLTKSYSESMKGVISSIKARTLSTKSNPDLRRLIILNVN